MATYNKLQSPNTSKTNVAKMAVVLVMLTLAATSRLVMSEISCEQIIILLTPCIPYGVFGGEVLPSCCSGIKESLALAKTKEDLRAKCECVIRTAALIPGLNYTRVNELPALCNTTSPYLVSPNTDCSRIA